MACGLELPVNQTWDQDRNWVIHGIGLGITEFMIYYKVGHYNNYTVTHPGVFISARHAYSNFIIEYIDLCSNMPTRANIRPHTPLSLVHFIKLYCNDFGKSICTDSGTKI